MRPKQTLRKILTGLLAVSMLAVLAPATALAMPRADAQPHDAAPAALGLSYDAVEIFAQEANVLTTLPGAVITNDTTVMPAGLAAGTVVEFIVGGVVTQLDAAHGEWRIGTPPVIVYESSQTVKTGTPALGDNVTVVGKRTVTAGPIVAAFITQVDPAPQNAAAPAVSTAFLFNGTVATAGTSTWSVTPTGGGNAVSFNILPAGGNGPTTMDPGLMVGSAATVEYVLNSALPPVVLQSGWNLLSTPVLLDPARDSLAQIFDATSLANTEAFLAFSGGQWIQATNTSELMPLHAIYVKVAAGKTANAILAPSTSPSGLPSLSLTAGPNLIGPAPALLNGTFASTALTSALNSVAQGNGNTVGYTMAVSPALNQAGWSYSLGGASQDMAPYKGYWVVMQNPATLYGFSTTPVGN